MKTLLVFQNSHHHGQEVRLQCRYCASWRQQDPYGYRCWNHRQRQIVDGSQSRLSTLKSPIATDFAITVNIIGSWKLPSAKLRYTPTFDEPELTTTRSSWLSLLKSPTAIDDGLISLSYWTSGAKSVSHVGSMPRTNPHQQSLTTSISRLQSLMFLLELHILINVSKLLMITVYHDYELI